MIGVPWLLILCNAEKASRYTQGKMGHEALFASVARQGVRSWKADRELCLYSVRRVANIPGEGGADGFDANS